MYECKNEQWSQFHDHSLIILDDEVKESGRDPSSTTSATTSCNSSSTTNTKSVNASTKYLEHHTVKKISAIERPETLSQLYIASGLRNKFHFSVPTVAIPVLFDVIKNTNNECLEILFIPRSCASYKSDDLYVRNGISIDFRQSGIDLGKVHEVILRESVKGNSKRSMNSISIGLQTMYSHEQHLARYSILSHSKPHIPTVKQHQLCVRKTLLASY